MLARHIFGYAPSLLIAALASFASVSLFTSVMSQAEYGQYTLAINAMSMLVGVGFFWLQSAASRLIPQAAAGEAQKSLFATLYGAFAVCGVASLVVGAGLACLPGLGDWRLAVWFAPPLAVLRALLNLNQAAHRNFTRIARYNIIEIGQAVLGLAVAALLVIGAHRGASGAALGLGTGLLAMALFDGGMLKHISARHFDRARFREIMQFGLPFIVTYGLSFILSRSDSFLIEHFLGPDQVGIYAAGYAFPDRVGQNLFMAVATASFPLVVRRMESEGVEAARDQTYTNGVAMLALAVPACIGLLLANRQIAAVLIGQDFRAGAEAIMPWIAVAAILNGLAAHYFDHAFHLAKKTRLFFFTLGPAALLNFAGNLYAIPHYGVMGAAYTTLAAYAVYLALSIMIGRRVFRIRFPFKPALQIALSAAIMALVLVSFAFPATPVGLIAMVMIGGAVYLLGLMSFNIMGLRAMLENAVQPRRAAAVAGLAFEIIESPDGIHAIAEEWQALHDKARRTVFGGYGWFALWWRHLGRSGGAVPHVVAARRGGRLVAVLPLAVRQSGLIRMLEWAGYEVFDYGDALAESAADAAAVWDYARRVGGYDIALMKDAHERAWSLPVLQAAMRPRGRRKNYFLTLDFASGEAWLAAQSRKLRGDTRRKRDKMQTRGTVGFNIYRAGDLVPLAVIDALYAQKAAWFRERKASGVFARAEVKDFLRELAQDAARRGMLYLAWLNCGDAIVACHMGFVDDGVLHLYHTTYDADYAAFSPGNILMTETIKAAIDAGWRELDFMRGDEAYKQRFAGGARDLADFVEGRSWLGKLAVRLRSAGGETKATGGDADDADSDQNAQ